MYLVPCRPSEVKKLKTVNIHGQQIVLPGESTKTGSPRMLPIPDEMLDYFNSIPRESEYIFYQEKRTAKNKVQYLPFKQLNCKKRLLGKAFKDADIKDFICHDLRHTSASNLRRAGISLELVMAIGGWKTMSTFLTYSNYTEDELLAPFRKSGPTLGLQKRISATNSDESKIEISKEEYMKFLKVQSA